MWIGKSNLSDLTEKSRPEYTPSQAIFLSYRNAQ